MGNICKEFNDYFIPVGDQLKSKIPPVKRHYLYYLGPKREAEFCFRKVNEESSLEVINSIRPKNSHGKDLLYNKMIKVWFPKILRTVTYLNNLSLLRLA